MKAYLVWNGCDGEMLQAVRRISDGAWMIEDDYENTYYELQGFYIWEEISLGLISCAGLIDFINDYQ